MKYFTDEERKTIEDMCFFGFDIKEIASKIGRTPSGVASEIRRNGGRNNYNAEKAIATALERRETQRIKSRMNKNTQRLGFEERQIIEALVKQGFTMSQIAKKINRSKNCVATEIRINGGSEIYNAQIGQDFAESRNQRRIKLLSDRNTLAHETKLVKKSDLDEMKEKIKVLEMHIEILHDALKESSKI